MKALYYFGRYDYERVQASLETSTVRTSASTNTGRQAIGTAQSTVEVLGMPEERSYPRERRSTIRWPRGCQDNRRAMQFSCPRCGYSCVDLPRQRPVPVNGQRREAYRIVVLQALASKFASRLRESAPHKAQKGQQH